MFLSKNMKEQLESLEKEKKNLELLKKSLAEQSPKIDINNLFILTYQEKYLIVEKMDNHIIRYNGINLRGTKPYLVDIFTRKTIYLKNNIYKIQHIEISLEPYFEASKTINACVFPIGDIEPSLLAFPNKQVPLYLLLELYYKLNNVSPLKNNHDKKLKK